MRRYLAHPFWQAVGILVLAFVVVVWIIPLLPGSAIVPKSVVLQYMLTVLVGVLIYVSDNEARWTEFKEPIRAVLVEPRLRLVRTALLVVVTALVGLIAYGQVATTVAAPPNLRSIHPAPPAEITFRGKSITLTGLDNPLRAHPDSLAAYTVEGKRIYYQNCLPCHGDHLDGQGHFASGFNPLPANFQDNGTIAQLTESFVFWRVAKGGPGLPREGTPWNSAMPKWEDFLTEREIWSVILFLYDQTGWKPRTWEKTGGGGGEVIKLGRHGGRAAGIALALLAAVPPCRLVAQDTTAGKLVYVKWCVGCHGETGAGDGPAASAMLPRPRNFTGAVYKIRTTASGQLPTDADLMRAIDEGVPGSAMPAWKSRLSDGERRNVMSYLKTFSSFFADTSQHVVALKFSGAPGGGSGAAALKEGRQFYDSIGCRKCHGDQGRGDGPSAPTLKDDAGFPIFAADLHQNWRFRGGAGVDDIYHRLRTGLDGTPMPSFSDLIDQKFLTDEQLWRLAQYVRSLSPAQAPEVRDVIHAPQIGGTPPVSPDDSAWAHVDRYWFPLVGQVIHKAREFAPAVSGVWVQAVHDGKTLSLRVSWDDRTQSPDTTWLAFEQRLMQTVASDDSGALKAQPWPDQLAVQFPRHLTDGMERPYFLMGSATDPVYQWRWISQPRRAVAGLARGIDQFDSLPAAPAARAVFDHGEWRVVLTRALATPDTGNEVQLEAGRAIPVAFFAWDGSSGEHGSRMALSTWYFLALDRPTPPGVFISPALAMLVTLGLGLVVVRRAQRRGTRRSGV